MNTNPNGRVNILAPKVEQQFAMYDKIPVNQCATYRDAMIGNWNSTNLSNLFFSSENINNIQNGIINGVYEMSKGQYKIGPQNCDTLKIIMRSIFLQYSANQPNDISQQIQALNTMVLDYAVPQVYDGVKSYNKYLYDASTLTVPMARPQQASYKTKTLELKRFF